jgi:mannose-6-phosphate isomerase-like protein (cupin superfamily)
MQSISLTKTAAELAMPWRSTIIGQAAGANLKVLRMDGSAYPDEVHDFDEALPVIEGEMHLDIADKITTVRAGEVFIVPSGTPHGVAAGSR